MKYTRGIFIGIVLGLIIGPSWVRAEYIETKIRAETKAMVNTEAQITVSITKINAATQTAFNAGVASKVLTRRYGVSAGLISKLHQKKWGLGEISILLAIASKLPGGASPGNIVRLEAMREKQSLQGWGALVQDLNLNVGILISEMQNAHIAVRDRILAAGGKIESSAKANSKTGADRKTERAESSVDKKVDGRVESTRIRIEKKEVRLRPRNQL